jgi:hypothetical protein
MSNIQNQTPKWIGPLMIVLGLLPIILQVEPTAGTPHWVAYLACSTFIIGGIMATAQSFGQIWINNLLGPVVIFIFAVIASWVAIAGGERCTGTLSIPGIKMKGPSACSIPFGLAALLCWGIFAGCVYSSLKGKQLESTHKK